MKQKEQNRETASLGSIGQRPMLHCTKLLSTRQWEEAWDIGAVDARNLIRFYICHGCQSGSHRSILKQLSREATLSKCMPPPLFTHLYTRDHNLWPLILKTFSAILTHTMNIRGEFHWNPSNTWNTC